MSRIGRTLQLLSAERQDRLVAAEQALRAPLPVVRRVAFASLAGGTGCSTVARRIAATLASRRAGGVLLVLAVGEEHRAEHLTGEGARRQLVRGVETITLPDSVWPDGIDNWRIHAEERHRAHELTLTDWGKLPPPQLFAVAAHSHLVCLTTSTERGAVQRTLDIAAALTSTGAQTLIIASAVRGRARLGARRMVAALPTPSQLMPFDPNARLAGGAGAGAGNANAQGAAAGRAGARGMAVSSVSQIALAELGGAIVAACGRANNPVPTQQMAVAR